MSDKKRKAKMGRPPIDPADRLTVRTTVRMKHVEFDRLMAEARRLGLPLGTVILKPWRDLWGK